MSVEQLQQISEAIDVFFTKARRKERSIANFRRLLRANERKLSPAINEWMKLMIGELQKGLAQVKGKKARLVAERLADWKYVMEQGEMILKSALLQVLGAGGDAVVGRKILKQERFDPIGVEAVEWATEHSAELVTEVATETKEAIKTFIADGVNAGKSIQKIARELRPAVGLTERYAGAVGKFATELYTSPKYRALSDAQRISKIERYAKKLHQVRTEMITRTETRNALWEGTFQGYGQMGIKRVKGISGPGACDWCVDNIDGKVYTIREARGIAAESHPSCACAWVAAAGEIPTRVAPTAPGAPKWVPAKSTAEAEKFALKNIVQTGGAVDYEKMALDSINIMNKELATLIEKYKIRPTFIGSWKGFRKYSAELYGERWQYFKRQFRMPRNAWGSYMEVMVGNTRITAIVARDEWWTEAGLIKLRESLLHCVETGWHKVSSPEYVFHHEFAHFLDNTYGITRATQFRGKYMEMVRAGKVKEAIGGYAYSDLSGEAWAELYANYKDGFYIRTNQPEMQKFADSIVKFIEERLK